MLFIDAIRSRAFSSFIAVAAASSAPPPPPLEDEVDDDDDLDDEALEGLVLAPVPNFCWAILTLRGGLADATST